MWQTKVLNTKEHEREWGNLLDALPCGDIFFTPEYAQLFESTGGETGREFGGEARLFFYGNEQDYVIYPFFQRKINQLPFAEAMGTAADGWYDIASPYGYSGPLARITNPELENALWQEFLERFHQYCLSNNIVTEFARLHPYLKNHIPLKRFSDGTTTKLSQIVYVDLRQTESQISQNMNRGNRSSVSKAKRIGVEITRSHDKHQLDVFTQLYLATMERNQAKEKYLFPREFFNYTFRLLHKNVRLFNAWYQGRIVAAAIFLIKNGLVHYHLGASDSDFFDLRANNLLFYQAILWAKGQGYELFNLGGGYEVNDSLFQFKSSFSKTTADFYIYSKVHNEEMYRLLCETREKYDTSQGRQAARPDFFPRYRS